MRGAALRALKRDVSRTDGAEFFETFSYLPPLDDDALMRQIDYMIRNAWVPCIEFEDAERAFTDSHGRINSLDSSVQSGYYDNRLWPMWKLPMFGSTQSSQVLQEINNCKEANPNCFIRLVGFDPNTQVQITSFLVYKPASRTQDVFRNVDDRQVRFLFPCLCTRHSIRLTPPALCPTLPVQIKGA
jgi:ribulose-bisphosphate carboxylase small chain